MQRDDERRLSCVFPLSCKRGSILLALLLRGVVLNRLIELRGGGRIVPQVLSPLLMVRLLLLDLSGLLHRLLGILRVCLLLDLSGLLSGLLHCLL